MFPLNPEEGLDELSKSIRVKTDRQADGQGRASRKRVAKSGPCEKSQGPGGEGEKLQRGQGWQRPVWQRCEAALGWLGFTRGHSRAASF